MASHKLASMPSDKQIYLPVLVGSKKNWNQNIDYQRDDEGINISEKNPYYNELTAIYWAWKNLDNVDAIGLVHYRRLFFKHFMPRKIKNVLDSREVNNLISRYKIILPRKRRYFIETNYSHYIHAHQRKPLDETFKVINDYYPEYISSFETVMNRRSAHMFNMFIMNKTYFDSYCSWLFRILDLLEKRIDISTYSRQEQRVFGYISELLMDVWILKNKVNYKEVRWGILGKSNTIKKVYLLIKRKIGFKTQTHF